MIIVDSIEAMSLLLYFEIDIFQYKNRLGKKLTDYAFVKVCISHTKYSGGCILYRRSHTGAPWRKAAGNTKEEQRPVWLNTQ